MGVSRQSQIAEVLIQGCDNAEIARELGMAPRTVKAHMTRLFVRFQVTGGIKRVKLAVILYRRRVCVSGAGAGRSADESGVLLSV